MKRVDSKSKSDAPLMSTAKSMSHFITVSLEQYRRLYTHVDKELGAESDEVCVVHGRRDGHAPGAPTVHEAQAARSLREKHGGNESRQSIIGFHRKLEQHDAERTSPDDCCWRCVTCGAQTTCLVQLGWPKGLMRGGVPNTSYGLKKARKSHRFDFNTQQHCVQLLRKVADGETNGVAQHSRLVFASGDYNECNCLPVSPSVAKNPPTDSLSNS